jgi:hypothetical protein
MMEGVMSTRLNYPCKVENQNGFTFIPESVVCEEKTKLWALGDHEKLVEEWKNIGSFEDYSRVHP